MLAIIGILINLYILMGLISWVLRFFEWVQEKFVEWDRASWSPEQLAAEKAKEDAHVEAVYRAVMGEDQPRIRRVITLKPPRPDLN